MTYQDFRRILLDASEFEDVEHYIAEVGGSLPETIHDKDVIPLMSDLYAFSREHSARCIREIAGLSQADFSREYKIPKRTLENWETNGQSSRTAPEYVLDMLAYAVICDKYLRM